MGFSLTLGSRSFSPRGNGTSVNSALTYADPVDLFRFRPGTTKGGMLSAGISRQKEKDVTTPQGALRAQATVSLSINVPSNGYFTQEDIDALISDISDAASPEVITRLLQGES